MSERIIEQEVLLREKQELIDALTERLERTAEQLDRLQRTNGDRGHWRAGGVPAELVDRQQALCGDLERVLEQWETAQPNQALERIESQLDRLHQLFHPPLNRGDSGGDNFRRGLPVSDDRELAPSPSASANGSTAWEALKAELLSQNLPEQAEEELLSAQESQTAQDSDPFVDEPLNVPPDFDLDSADLERLRTAIVERDECIADLLKRYRAVESRTRPTDDWKALEGLPEALRVRVESLEQRLEQMQRLGEIELSLERAKLSREASRLRQRETGVSRSEPRPPVIAPHSNDGSCDGANEETPGEGRWLRMLGIKRDR